MRCHGKFDLLFVFLTRYYFYCISKIQHCTKSTNKLESCNHSLSKRKRSILFYIQYISSECFFLFFFFVYRTILITQGVLFSANWNTINCDLMNNTSIAIDNVGSDIKLSAGSITPANLIVTRVRFRHRRYSALTTI